MKKLVSLLLAMILVLSLVPAAVADQVMLNPDENRKIKLQKVGLNEAEEGVSPTTGLYLEDLEAPAGFAGLAVTGRYMPMLVQIDNTSGGIDARAPWVPALPISCMRPPCTRTVSPVCPSCIPT